MIRISIALLIAAFVSSESLGQTSTAPKGKKFTLETDLVYRKIDDKPVKLDLAYPKEGKGPFPVVVCVHGGAWRLGSKKEMRDWIEFFAENGFVAASVGYRLIPEGKWPGQVEDVQTAVRWLRSNAEKYNLDPKRLGAMGFSAGGHLVSFLGMIDKCDGFECKDFPEVSSKVRCVVNYFGPCDLTYYGSDESAQNAVFEPMFGYRFKDNAECYKKGSPINYITKDTVPFLIFHGTEDRLVPIEQSRKLNEKLKDVGVPVKLIEFKGADHGWTGENNRLSTRTTLEFFTEHLKK
jgi:acetyl esterase/lipase